MYLDPGFGSMFIQIIVAIVAASGVFLYSMRRKISALFSKRADGSAQTKGDAITHGAAAQSIEGGYTDDVVDMLADEETDDEANKDKC